MKKTLALLMLAGLMLTGCGSKQASAQTETAKATAVAANTIEVPDVVGLTLDKAIDQLQSIGLKAHATDVDEGKTIFIEKNWQVASEDPLAHTKVAEGSTVELGVKHLTDETPTPTPTPSPTQVAAKIVAPVAPPVVKAIPVAPPVVKAPPAAPPVVKAPPAPYVPPAPAAAYYATCTAVRQAGAAPIYAGQPGYSRKLDRDGDGVACE
ncbi:excalibur calcium-binding domain-containing protein [Arthrobacter sp. ov407]|uniref:excalibur calcium-binding domain-containing protein n=1 Tax=Arthrobacter sp. ov407 TaxID=1761748 RepID=UPI000B853121|nr:excalibur calcium-binding domain-containing protein [Arthrobacter sp. ov407]